jgi:hypothetical protein
MQEEINTVNPETPVEVKEVEKVSEAVIVPEEKVGEVTEAIVSAPVEEVKQVVVKKVKKESVRKIIERRDEKLDTIIKILTPTA